MSGLKKQFYSIEDLKKLVKSLSGAERRHFSLLSATFKKSDKEPVYLTLFQRLSDDESELSDFNELPKLVTIKNRLFKNILRSLRLFHQDKSVEINIQNSLSDIEVLNGLGLSRQAYYLWQRAYQLAVDNEKFALVLQLLEWEKKMNMVLDEPSRSINEIAEEENRVLNQFTQLTRLENLFGRMKNLKRQYGQIKAGSDQDLHQEILNVTDGFVSETYSSQKAKFYYNFTYTIYNWIIHHHEDAYKYSKELLGFESKVILSGDYMDGLLEHSTSCIQIGKFKEALETLEHADAMLHQLNLDQVPMMNTKLFFYTVGYHLVIYNYSGDRNKLEATIHRAEKEIRLHENNMPLEAKQVLTANLMNAYVGMNHFKKVDEIWESLFQKTSKNIRRSIYDDLRLFRLFSLLQHKEYVLLPSMALSAYRYYNKSVNSPVDFELEIKVSGLLMKDYDYENEIVVTDLLNALKDAVTAYIQALSPVRNFMEHYTFYVIWLESIIAQKPFFEIAAMWYQNHADQNL